MQMISICLLVIGLIPLISSQASSACDPNLISTDGDLLTLSDDLLDAKLAEEKCSSKGGHLVSVPNQRIKSSLKNALSKYTKNLQKVWVFHDPSNPNVFRYSKKEDLTKNWKHTVVGGKSWYFYLYKEQPPNADVIQIWFCHPEKNPDRKWLVKIKTPCSAGGSGWKEDFSLYTTSSEVPGSVALHVYTSGVFSTMLSLQRKNPNNFTERTEPLHVLADLNVLIGPRRTRIGVCEQPIMHYGVTWETRSKKCSNEKAFYVCQNKLVVTSQPVGCNGLNISWNEDLNKLPQTKNGNPLSVQVIGSRSVPRTTNFSQGNILLRSLQPDHSYPITVTVKFPACVRLSVAQTISAKTGKPFPIPNGLTSQKAPGAECVLTLRKPSRIRNERFNFEVLSFSNESKGKEIFQTDEFKTQFVISLEDHRPNTEVKFKLRRLHCKGQGMMKDVEGSCVVSSKKSGRNTGLIVGLVVAVIALLALTLVAAILCRRKMRRNRKHPASMHKNSAATASNHFHETYAGERSEENQVRQEIVIESPSASAPPKIPKKSVAVKNYEASDCNSIAAEKLSHIYVSGIAKNCKKFKKEFDDIKSQSKSFPNSCQVALSPNNQKKNRYKNVLPFDETRVILIGDRHNDYINASHIQGYRSPQKFIAAQGPRDETVNDFWRMVWEKGITVLVMLCECVEFGKRKCAKYWPDSGSVLTFGEYQIKTIMEYDLGGIVQRSMTISNHQEKRTVTQLQYQAWPDHGIPVTSSNMMYLRKLVEEMSDKLHPIVVHCSAGAGRTGTYIAMDILFDQLDAEGKVEVENCMLKMRQCRTDMVQTLKQYIFIHRLLVEHYVSPPSDLSIEEFLARSNDEWYRLIPDEYECLRLLSQSISTQATTNKDFANADNSVFVVLPSSTNEHRMKASYIKEPSFARTFIAAQSPDTTNEDLFWLMVLQCGMLNVIELEPSDSATISSLQLNDEAHIGDITVLVNDVTTFDGFIVQKLYISSKDRSQDPITVTHICGFEWYDDDFPPNPSVTLTALRQVDLYKDENESRISKVLVHCRNGCTRCGMIIACMNVCERLDKHKKIGVFRCIKDLRDINPNMIDNMNLYSYCYDVTASYIECYREYANFD